MTEENRQDLAASPSGRNLLPGPSAFVSYSREFRLGVPAAVAPLLLSFLAVMKAPQWLVNIAVVVMLATAVPALVLHFRSLLKDWAERRAGYTTLPTKHRELEQRDPYFGATIRNAGQPYLDKQYFDTLVADAKGRWEEAPRVALRSRDRNGTRRISP